MMVYVLNKKYNIIRKKVPWYMADKDNKKKGKVKKSKALEDEQKGTAQPVETETVQIPEKAKGSKFKNRLFHFIIFTVLAAIGAAVLEGMGLDVYAYIKSFLKLPSQVESLQATMHELTASNKELSTLLIEYNNRLVALEAVDSHKESRSIVLSDGFEIETVVVNDEIILSNPIWTGDDTIAKDLFSDRVYEAKELYFTRLLIPYREGNNEVYFYGQFNERNHWNGQCVLNVYNNNKLVSIIETIYDDGIPLNYKRISANNETWSVSDRINMGDYNSGETWVFQKTEDYNKVFTSDNVTSNQILDVENFQDYIDGRLLSYYNGNTSGGYYNDDTGNAYLVIYFNDYKGIEGNVIRTLYQGIFKDGKFEDNTHNAWYLTRDLDTTYMFFQGVFSNNRSVNDIEPKTFDNYLSQEQVLEKLTEKGFEEYMDEFLIDYTVEPN